MTKIEWCDFSWNPIKMRCSPVSEGCTNCYSKRILSRNLPGMNYPAKGEPPRLDEKTLNQPFHWKKPLRIFVESMGDLFHEDVTNHDLARIFMAMESSKQHTFIVLTKRPKRMADFAIKWATQPEYPPSDGMLASNIWLGVTAENQRTADERIPILLQIPAAVHFVSVEPMLGPVNMFGNGTDEQDWTYNGPDCKKPHVGWVICGGETGPGARPMNPIWASDLLHQCQNAGVPFFFKSWGGTQPPKNHIPQMPREWPR